MSASEEPATKRIKTEEEEEDLSRGVQVKEEEGCTTVSVKKEAGEAATPVAASLKQEEDADAPSTSMAIKQEENVAQVTTSEDAAVKQENDDSTTAFHFREDCPIYPYDYSQRDWKTQELFCDRCRCFACDLPVSECKTWKHEHVYATKKSEYWQGTRQDNVERQTWLANPVVNLFDDNKDCTRNYEEQRKRCRESPFYYKDPNVFEMALECYNLQSTKEGYLSGFKVAKQRHSYTRKEARASHKNPCCCCEKKFITGMHYFVNQYNSSITSFSLLKYCVGCMGRIVAFHVSPDAQVVEEKLAAGKVRIEEIEQRAAEEMARQLKEQEENAKRVIEEIQRNSSATHRG